MSLPQPGTKVSRAYHLCPSMVSVSGKCLQCPEPVPSLSLGPVAPVGGWWAARGSTEPLAQRLDDPLLFTHPARTPDCMGTKVTMPGRLWETTGLALPRTDSRCFRYTSCSLWFRSSSVCAAKAFCSLACCCRASAFRRMKSCKDSELCGWPREPLGLGQGVTCSFAGLFCRKSWAGSGHAGLTFEEGGTALLLLL